MTFALHAGKERVGRPRTLSVPAYHSYFDKGVFAMNCTCHNDLGWLNTQKETADYRSKEIILPVLKVLSENPGIIKASLSTVHAYTSTQAIVDGPIRGGHDFRKGRAAAQNTVPETTGAAISVTRAIPDLKGKFDGLSFRVPNITGSISDITFIAKRPTTVEEIAQILTDAAGTERWKGILQVTRDQLVSSDIIGQPFGATVPLDLIKVIDGDMVKVLSWYDNEAGYVSTLIKHVEKVSALL